MTTAVKRLLSASVDGKGIKIAAVVSPGTLIHTAVAGTTAGSYDELWLWAYNSDIANTVLWIEWGDADLPRKLTVPLQVGVVPIIPGFILQNGQTVRIYASAPNVVKVDGFVNRIADASA